MCILLQCHYARLASEWSGENIDYWVIRTEEKILIVKRALSSPLGSFPTCRKSSIHSVWLERLLRSLCVRCFEWSDITECKDEMQVNEGWNWQLDSGWGASSRFVLWQRVLVFRLRDVWVSDMADLIVQCGTQMSELLTMPLPFRPTAWHWFPNASGPL